MILLRFAVADESLARRPSGLEKAVSAGECLKPAYSGAWCSRFPAHCERGFQRNVNTIPA